MRLRMPNLSDQAKQWLFIVAMLIAIVAAWAMLHTDSFGQEVELVDAEVTVESIAESSKGVSTKLCPPMGKDIGCRVVLSDRVCKNCFLESIPDFEPVQYTKKDLADGGQYILAWGKPGTRVRMVRFFDESPNMLVTRFVLSGAVPDPDDPVKPEPVTPVTPVVPKPDPPKPEPVKPVDFESLHLVILEDPRATHPNQSGMIRQLRLSGQGYDRMTIYDVRDGQDETGQQSANVKAFISNVDSGGSYPYWFIVAAKSGKGTIMKEGSLTSTAEVIDELRQARRVGRQVIRSSIPAFSNPAIPSFSDN